MLIAVFSAAASASGFLTLGYDYAFLGKNDLLASGSASVPYFNFDLGHMWEPGISVAFKYDHLNLEDFVVSGQNARVVAVITSISLGYAVKVINENFYWWSSLNAGYAVSARLRLGITDHKAGGFAPSVTTALYYKLIGKFYAGLEAGYRYVKVNYSDIAGSPELDLGGFFLGISLKHIFG